MIAVAAVAAVSFAQIPQEIVVDQFGYREQARKIAIGRLPFGAPSVPIDAGPFRVIDVETGDAVFEGNSVLFRNGVVDAASGDIIWHLDFSSVTAPGRYYVTMNGINSYPFNIADGVYNDVLKAAVKTFYYQRAGTAKPAQYAGTEWADDMNFEQDRRTRYFYDSTNAALERDLSGGWFDAGDYNKYTKWTANYITEMMLMYGENPAAFTDDFGIPESGNGIPDILDEAMWGLDWLFRMQNEDGAMLSVQGLAGGYGDRTGSPPSIVTGRSYYGPPNATATFGSVKAFATAARVLGGVTGINASYIDSLRTAALKAWDWGIANPDSIFHNNCGDTWNKHLCPNYDSRGLAAGNQELVDPWDRVENYINAAFALYELTGVDSFLTIFENNLSPLPLYDWGNVMQQYRHDQHTLYMRYLEHPSGSASVKSDMRNRLRIAVARENDFLGAYPSDGYRAFIYDYQWGSNKVKNDYGLTFYKWHIVDQAIDRDEFTAMAAGYLHYIHGVNPFNWVYLTNMNRYGASRSLTTIYHTWFSEDSDRWSITTATSPGPAPGFMPGGPNAGYTRDGQVCSWPGRCQVISIPEGTPPAKRYAETNLGWPVNSWEITENMNAYQLSYIRLLSKFVDWSSPTPPVSVRPGAPAAEQRTAGVRYRMVRRGVQITVKERAEVKIFTLNGAAVSTRNFTGGVHNVSLARLPKGMYIIRMTVDGQRAVLRMSNTM
jgi:hypothetical protein